MLIYWFWSLPEEFWRILKVFVKFKKFKMADPRWPPIENKALLWRHMTSSAEVVDLNGNIFGRYYLSFKFRCHSFIIFSELRGGTESAPPPDPQDPKKPGLNRVKDNLWLVSLNDHNLLTKRFSLNRDTPLWTQCDQRCLGKGVRCQSSVFFTFIFVNLICFRKDIKDCAS